MTSLNNFVAASLVAVLPISFSLFGAIHRPEESIRHLTSVHQNEKVNDGKPFRHPACTTFALKTRVGVKWVANFHCLIPGDTDLQIGENAATVIIADPSTDIAIFDGEDAPGLRLSSSSARVGDPVAMIGYPFGWSASVYRVGVYSSQQFDVNHSGVPLGIIQVPAAPGDSGSPVLDNLGRVVGMMKEIFCEDEYSFCPMSGVVSREDIAQLVSILEHTE